MATKHAAAQLPAFSFPQLPDDNDNNNKDNALPAFSFPQAGENRSQPSSPALPPHGRPHGHRRRPSELTIGENIAVPSPTKSSGSMPTPPSLPAPGPGMSGAPGPGRRGHAHRRSAAISSVDLTAVTKAFPPLPLAGSAPTTPADFRQQHLLNDDASRPTSRSFPNMSPRTPPITPKYQPDLPSQPSHLRVELYESQHGRRPLSTISSEGSVSTARGNHSTTASMASATQGTSQAEKTHTRPKTAGPRLDLDRSSPELDKPIPREHKRPLSMSASATLSVLGITHPSKSSNQSTKPNEETTPPSTSLGRKRSSSSNADSIVVHKTRSRSSPEKKSNKKQKKVRSWAGIISRKTKKRSKKSKKAPTPPPILTRTSSAASNSESISDVNFDDDQIIVLRTPTDPSAPSQPPVETSENRLSLDTSWKPRSFYEQGRELDMYSPVIDLDAALGPFNTPEMSSDPKSMSGFSVATKRMYSGGRRGEFVGPEMRYHRRAESAPVMQPFDRTGLGMARASSLANPDVFYEEDEDNFLAGRDVSKPADKTSEEKVSTSPVGSPEEAALELVESRSSATVTPESPDGTERDFDTSGLGIQVVDAADTSDMGDMSRGRTDRGPETAHASHEPATPESASIEASKPEYSGSSCDNNIQIVESDEWPLPAEEASTSPSYFSDRRPATSPDLTCTTSKTLTLPEMPTHNPAYPSPNPSNISFDARLPTASSSMTDRNTFHSAYSTDPGTELFHGSVEDVPSLTSSASTMTGNAPRLSSSFYSRVKGDRAASFSANGTRRSSRGNSHKRSSLVSLSKLMTGSTGEKSKLSYEEKAPSDDVEKAKKKGHRISRLMHFWKVKEKEKAKERSH